EENKNRYPALAFEGKKSLFRHTAVSPLSQCKSAHYCSLSISFPVRKESSGPRHTALNLASQMPRSGVPRIEPTVPERHVPLVAIGRRLRESYKIRGPAGMHCLSIRQRTRANGA